MTMKLTTLAAASGVVLCCTAITIAHAGSVLPEETVAALERFYHHFDGNNWHNNEGWLEPGSDPCDWRGVRCSQSDSGLYGLSLPSNNLVGVWHESDIAEFATGLLELPGNRISGHLHEIPYWLNGVDLSENELSSELPGLPEDAAIEVTWLRLAHNSLEGEVPESWRRFALSELDLAGNRLGGSLDGARLAMSANPQGYLNLADNLFSGPLPQSIMNLRVSEHNDFGWPGGINLCWNEFEVEPEELDTWIGRHHIGGAGYQTCLDRERVPIDQEVSGTWYDRNRSGEGITLQLLADGRPLLFMFTFDRGGRSHWLYEVGASSEVALHWRRMSSTRGRFTEGVVPIYSPYPDQTVGSGLNWRLDRTGGSALHFERIYYAQCVPAVPWCLGSVLSDRLDYVQLTRLAGTTCDNRQPHEWISGAWYDPERSGEGFIVEVIEDGRGVVYWFTYEPDDSLHQTWMMGDGDFDGSTLTIDNLVQPRGGRWGDDFDAAEIERVHWGGLIMEFTDDDSGHIYWDSVLEDFGAGDYPIQRLARARLAECG